MKNVTIVGAGALGSHVAMLLRNEASLKVVDFDRVEQKNTLSQFHGKPGVGKPKVQALAQAIQLLWGHRVGTVPHRLTNENDDQLLSGSDLVIDCLDNGASRRVVQGFARRSHTPCLHGALAPGGTLGRAVWDEQFVVDDEPGHGAATCEGGEHLPFIALVAGYVAYAAQSFLTRGIRRGFHIFPGGATAL
jgi:predicted ThiF/HesA family dinucleotide-utilizing enzyme